MPGGRDVRTLLKPLGDEGRFAFEHFLVVFPEPFGRPAEAQGGRRGEEGGGVVRPQQAALAGPAQQPLGEAALERVRGLASQAAQAVGQIREFGTYAREFPVDDGADFVSSPDDVERVRVSMDKGAGQGVPVREKGPQPRGRGTKPRMEFRTALGDGRQEVFHIAAC